jgi:hypothetical protein
MSDKKQPAYRLFTVSGEGEDANWTNIGAAWPNKDGKGFVLTFAALPIDGRVVMRVFEPKADTKA